MTNLGHNWLCSVWIKHSVGRDSACCDSGMTILGQDWLFFCESMTFLGQDWLCSGWKEYSVGRQSACYDKSMTNLGRDWLFFCGSMTFFGQDWSYYEREERIKVQD